MYNCYYMLVIDYDAMSSILGQYTVLVKTVLILNILTFTCAVPSVIVHADFSGMTHALLSW